MQENLKVKNQISLLNILKRIKDKAIKQQIENKQSSQNEQNSDSDQDQEALQLFKKQEELLNAGNLSKKQSNKQNQRRVTFNENIEQPNLNDQQLSWPFVGEGRKWNQPLNQTKLGLFTQQQKAKLGKAVALFMRINNLNQDEFINLIQDGKIRQLKLYQSLQSVVPERSVISVYRFIRRYYCKCKPKNWTKEEEDNLLSLVSKYGRKWVKIGKLMDRTSQSVLDKYRNLGQQNNQQRVKGVWTFTSLVQFLKLIDLTTKKHFLHCDIDKQLNNAQKHDEIEKQQTLSRIHNSKNFLFHNLEVIRMYINAEVFQTIQKKDISWFDISSKIKIKSPLDCRNKFIQMLQLYFKKSQKSYGKVILSFIKAQNVEYQNDINWNKWKNAQIKSNQARNWFMVTKKSIEGRAGKSLKAIIQSIEKKMTKQNSKI